MNPQVELMHITSFSIFVLTTLHDKQAPLSAPALAHEAATAAAAAISAAAAAGAVGKASSADADAADTLTRQARTSARPHWDAAALRKTLFLCQQRLEVFVLISLQPAIALRRATP